MHQFTRVRGIGVLYTARSKAIHSLEPGGAFRQQPSLAAEELLPFSTEGAGIHCFNFTAQAACRGLASCHPLQTQTSQQLLSTPSLQAAEDKSSEGEG